MPNKQQTTVEEDWCQLGFAVVSDSPAGGPLLHTFRAPRWEAEKEMERSGELPEHLRRNIRVLPAELRFRGTFNAR